VSGPTKAAVQDALKNLRKEIDGGITKPAPANYTVRRCCEDWLAGGLPGRDPKTVAKNRFVLEPVLAMIGTVRLRDLDVTDVDRVSRDTEQLDGGDGAPGADPGDHPGTGQGPGPAERLRADRNTARAAGQAEPQR
jgi:hypothetical protein